MDLNSVASKTFGSKNTLTTMQRSPGQSEKRIDKIITGPAPSNAGGPLILPTFSGYNTTRLGGIKIGDIGSSVQ